jgi:lipid-binding SYLF domain-containing protein
MSETAWERTKRFSGAAYDKAVKPTYDKALKPTYDKALKPTYDHALKPTYDKALKPGFDKAWKVLDKLGAPINRLSNRVGAEAFWPTSLDKESDKAARILRSFCKDGFYQKIDTAEAQKAKEDGEVPVGPQGKQRVLKKIPESVIKKAKGLAIFTTMRTGLWVSGAGGSGVLVARNEETGEWSPPSGILLHTAGLGFLVGVDIYDCVIVINTYKALEAFTKIRCTLGGEISAVAGPVGIGGLVETEVHKRQSPLFTYLKSRGFYAGVQVDGTIVIERTDENEVFYGERIGVADILAGKAKNPPKDKYRLLMNTIHAAQGDTVDDIDLPSAADPTPSDFEINAEGKFR